MTVRHRVWPLIVLETLVAVSAVYGSVGLMWDDMIGMPDEWLEGTPFSSWVLPGTFLLLVVAVPMGVAALLEVRSSTWAALASIMAGAAQVGWIGLQLLIMQRYNVLQPVMLGLGLLIMLAAVWSGRQRALFPPPLLRRRSASRPTPR